MTNYILALEKALKYFRKKHIHKYSPGSLHPYQITNNVNRLFGDA